MLKRGAWWRGERVLKKVCSAYHLFADDAGLRAALLVEGNPKLKAKDRPFIEFALHLKLALVHFDQAFRNGQSQAYPLQVELLRGKFLKALKNRFVIAFMNAYASVLDAHAHGETRG